MKTITYRGKVYRCPYYDLLPPLSRIELEELRDDLRTNGVFYPVFVDGDIIIDGHNRLEIAAKYVLPVRFESVSLKTNAARRRMALDLNLHRRHLPPKERRALSIQLRREGKSYRVIGEKLKVSPMTAKRDVEGATVTNDTVDLPERITGKDGKARPAKAPKKPTRRPIADPEEFRRGHAESEPVVMPRQSSNSTAATGGPVRCGSIVSFVRDLEIRIKELMRISRLKVADRDPAKVRRELSLIHRGVSDLEAHLDGK